MNFELSQKPQVEAKLLNLCKTDKYYDEEWYRRESPGIPIKQSNSNGVEQIIELFCVLPESAT